MCECVCVDLCNLPNTGKLLWSWFCLHVFLSFRVILDPFSSLPIFLSLRLFLLFFLDLTLSLNNNFLVNLMAWTEETNDSKLFFSSPCPAHSTICASPLLPFRFFAHPLTNFPSSSSSRCTSSRYFFPTTSLIFFDFWQL